MRRWRVIVLTLLPAFDVRGMGKEPKVLAVH
jgi:hypothetical protein